MIQYVGNVGIIAEMSDICPEEPKIFPCATDCDWAYVKDPTNGIEYKECTKCHQKIILEFRI